MKAILFALLVVCSTFAIAQDTGTLEGTLTDKESGNQPLPFANVLIKGTTKGATTDFDGNYIIKNVPVGTYTVEFSFVGYETVAIPNVLIEKNKFTNVSTALGASAAALNEVVIQVQTSREREEALLLERKNAVISMQSIGAQELSRKGVSDAEGAVTKLSGISKQQGVKNVFVRGLGDRYNFTTLNGIPLPSEDPEYKNIALDFFSSGLLEAVDVSKVFSPDLYGDVAGANMNIALKGLTSRESFGVSVSTGFNGQTVGEDFKRIDGTNFIGFSEGNIPISNLSNYTFDNNFAPNDAEVLPNIGLTLEGGKRYDIGDDYLNVYGYASFDNDYRYVDGVVRNTNSVGNVYLDQDFEKYQYNVSQVGMLNFDYHFNSNSIQLITMYLHNSTQSLEEYQGTNNPEQDGDEVFVRRQQVNENNLLVNQLNGKFSLSDALELNASVGYNFLKGIEPDRRNVQYLFRNGFYSPNIDSGGNNQRYFSDLQENDLNGLASLKWNLNPDGDRENELNFGVNTRFTQHDFAATIFNHNFPTRVEIDLDRPDEVFNQNSLNNNVFVLETGRGRANNPNAFLPFTYNGEKTIYAGYVSYTNRLAEPLILNAGVRFENISQETVFNTNVANSELNGPSIIEESLFLPSMSLKYNLNEDNIVRLSASKTYILPRFKETAPFRYDNPGGTATQGNPDLILSDVYNLDLGYEFFPSESELLSLNVFYKNIKNPISRTEIPSGGNTLTYLNVGETATVFGVEAEVRKNIFSTELGEDSDGNMKTSDFIVGLNVSYLNSQVDLQDALAQFTYETSDLEGAAPFLLNADINYNTYLGDTRWNNAIVANYFTERVFSIGTRGFENIREIGIPTLDYVSSLEIGERSKISLKARNLLNPEYRLERESSGDNPAVELSSFRRGFVFSIGYSYGF